MPSLVDCARIRTGLDPGSCARVTRAFVIAALRDEYVSTVGTGPANPSISADQTDRIP